MSVRTKHTWKQGKIRESNNQLVRHATIYLGGEGAEGIKRLVSLLLTLFLGRNISAAATSSSLSFFFFANATIQFWTTKQGEVRDAKQERKEDMYKK